MALTAEQQAILDHALAALPDWFRGAREQEFLGLAAEVIGNAKVQVDDWFGNALITTAVGPVGFDPDWLNQHAKDRGTSRRDGETDAALRIRLRNIEDALTRPILLDAVQDILDEAGIVGTPAMVELRFERAYFRTLVADTGTGGEFFGTAPNMEFQPTVAFARGKTAMTTQSDIAQRLENPAGFADTRLVISGAASAGNNGTFDITDVSDDRVLFTNASGVAGADATVSWEQQGVDRAGNVLEARKDAYFSRGHRMARGRASLIVILPFGCTAATQASVNEEFRQKAGAGINTVVECRTSP